MAKLNEMIRDFRLNIGQSVEALALLMQMDPEDYARLEENWIPPEDVLERLCALFEWNYQEVKQLAQRTPSHRKRVEEPSSEQWSLAKMLREARENAGQPPLGIATLMGIPEEQYASFEAGESVPEELLQRLCTLYRWNFHQVRQRVRRHNAMVFTGPQKPLSFEELRERLPPAAPLQLPELEEHPTSGIGTLLRQTREGLGQSIDGVSLLLEVSPDYYELLEAGEVAPDDELLRRIASVFRWNYNELRSREQKLRMSRLRPSVTQLPEGGSFSQRRHLREVFDGITKGWDRLNKTQRDALMAQLELVRDSVQRWTQSAPVLSSDESFKDTPPAPASAPPASPPEPAFKNNVRKPPPDFTP